MNRVKQSKIDKCISDLLERFNISHPPVDVNKIAKKLNIEIKVKPYEGNDDLSGILVRDYHGTFIGVNALHLKPRQRFTIAHELGHFLLHEVDPLFIDKKISIYYRHSRATDGVDEKEVEANNFAGMLLIPTKFLEDDLKKEAIDILDEEVIRKLAKKYKVSEQAMSIRLARL